MALQLTDIRCGCGGLCDGDEPCPMRSHVEACDCTYQPTHSTKQHKFVLVLLVRYHQALEFDWS